MLIFSTTCGGKTFFLGSENPVLVSLVVKQVLDQESYNYYAHGFSQCLILD